MPGTVEIESQYEVDASSAVPGTDMIRAINSWRELQAGRLRYKNDPGGRMIRYPASGRAVVFE